ncbi:MAG: N-acetylmuramoyl-L-alanine amidase, partial [Kiritimatiellia bacterium]|nr:N-acetylmuramoyl-L-alanine amidase [Kiritimatiellia bacterium]
MNIRFHILWMMGLWVGAAHPCAAGPTGPSVPNRASSAGVRVMDLVRPLGGVAAPHDRNLRFEFRRGSGVRWEPDGRKMDVDGIRIWMHETVSRASGSWRMGKGDAERLAGPILRPAPYLAGWKGDWTTVVIDPGHGGIDSGAVSAGGLEEKQVVLDIARRVRTRLEAAGVRVVLTRDADDYVELNDRLARALIVRPFAFVSLHLNSAPSTEAQGVETFILSKAGQASTNAKDPSASPRYRSFPGNRQDAANAILGFALHRQMIRGLRAEDRGLRQARFQVLKNAPFPAVLLECAFLSNPKEAQKLNREAHLDAVADAVAAGVLEFRAIGERARLQGFFFRS